MYILLLIKVIFLFFYIKNDLDLDNVLIDFMK